MTKKNLPTEKIEVNVFDDTAEATLTLWQCTTASASVWKASHTILLITNAEFKNDRKPTLTLKNETLVDVDPAMTDAESLRAYADRITKKQCVNQPFPEGGRYTSCTYETYC